MSFDINPILEGWGFEPGKLSVRRITGADGRDKIQLRLDLGLLQMELTGRPDGQRPFGCESYLEYYKIQLSRHVTANGDDSNFVLDAEACRNLRVESVMYYHRYLSAFALDDYTCVIKDTTRNIESLDMCRSYGDNDDDRLSQEGYRPYILMMRTRASALLALESDDYERAAAVVRKGIDEIVSFGEQIEHAEEVSHGAEIEILQALLEEIEQEKPLDPVGMLEKELKAAVDQERYEDAARLRDQLNIIKRPKKY